MLELDPAQVPCGTATPAAAAGLPRHATLSDSCAWWLASEGLIDRTDPGPGVVTCSRATEGDYQRVMMNDESAYQSVTAASIAQTSH